MVKKRSIASVALLLCLLQGSPLSAFTLTKSNSNTLTLGTGLPSDGANGDGSLTGVDSFLITGGTVAVANAAAIGSGVPVTISDGALLNISGASISIGPLAGGSTLSSSTLVNLGAQTLTVNESSSTNFDGVIAGLTGSLVKSGAGTLTLRNVNTYAGTTTVSAGTLALSGSGAIGSSSAVALSGATLDVSGVTLSASINTLSGSGAITLGSKALVISQGTDQTFSGAIGGTGGVITKSGLAKLTLSGSSNYTGGTTISQGTLSIASANNIGGGTAGFTLNGGTLMATGAVSTSGSVSVTESSTIDASGGSVTLSGTMTGSNGKTLASSGTLSLQTVAVAGTDTFTISGNLSGSQVLTKTGTGTLTLTGTNDYTAGTTISAGTVIGNATAFGSGAITCSGTINFNQTTTGTLSDTISGTGTFIKSGAALLNMDATVTQGTALINQGTLAVLSGRTLSASSTTVAAGALLQGNGTIGRAGATFTNNGTVQPGSSIGTLHIIGDFVANAGSTLEVEFGPTPPADLLDVTGTFTINPGAILHIFPDPTGPYQANTVYTVVSAAGGVIQNAQFTVTSSLPSFDATVLYSANLVRIIVGLSPFSVIVTDGNAGQAANCLGGPVAATGSDLETIYNSLLFMDVNEMTYAISQMQPSLYNGFDLCEEETLVNVRNAITKWQSDFDRNECRSDNQLQFWNSYFYTQGNQGALGYEAGFHTTTQAGVTGAHYRGHSNAFCGAAFAYTNDHIRWKGNVGSGQVNSYYGGAYAGIKDEKLYFQLVAMGGGNNYEGHRNIFFPATELPGFSRTADHENWGWSGLGSAELGFLLPFNSHFECHSFGRFDYTFFHRNEATETGANSLDLYLDPHNAQMVRGEVGLDFFGCYDQGGGTFLPKAKVAYVFERRFNGASSQASFLFSPGCTMNVTGMEPSRQLLSYSLGIDMRAFSDSLLLGVEWEGQSGEHFFSSNTIGQLKWSF